MEWDTAAAHSILKALEIPVINHETGRELFYNKENLSELGISNSFIQDNISFSTNKFSTRI